MSITLCTCKVVTNTLQKCYFTQCPLKIKIYMQKRLITEIPHLKRLHYTTLLIYQVETKTNILKILIPTLHVWPDYVRCWREINNIFNAVHHCIQCLLKAPFIHCLWKQARSAKLNSRSSKTSRIEARVEFPDVRGLSRNFRDNFRDSRVEKTKEFSHD